MVNSSLIESVFPASFKEALMCPRRKKPSMDSTILDNFCPDSHFPYLGKVVEKVVALQMQRILDETDYLDPFQSSFRPGYGTEMALVTVLDDFCQEQMGIVHPSLLFLTAFDTTNNGILGST